MLATKKCKLKQTAEIEVQIQTLQCIKKGIKDRFRPYLDSSVDTVI
jgi:predicted phage-related endonuclease